MPCGRRPTPEPVGKSAFINPGVLCRAVTKVLAAADAAISAANSGEPMKGNPAARAVSVFVKLTLSPVGGLTVETIGSMVKAVWVIANWSASYQSLKNALMSNRVNHQALNPEKDMPPTY